MSNVTRSPMPLLFMYSRPPKFRTMAHPPVARLAVGVHQDALGKRGQLALDVDDAHVVAHLPHVHRYLCLGHVTPPFPIYLLYLLGLAAQGLQRAGQILFVSFSALHQDTDTWLRAFSLSEKTLTKSEKRVILNFPGHSVDRFLSCRSALRWSLRTRSRLMPSSAANSARFAGSRSSSPYLRTSTRRSRSSIASIDSQS